MFNWDHHSDCLIEKRILWSMELSFKDNSNCRNRFPCNYSPSILGLTPWHCMILKRSTQILSAYSATRKSVKLHIHTTECLMQPERTMQISNRCPVVSCEIKGWSLCTCTLTCGCYSQNHVEQSRIQTPMEHMLLPNLQACRSAPSQVQVPPPPCTAVVSEIK